MADKFYMVFDSIMAIAALFIMRYLINKKRKRNQRHMRKRKPQTMGKFIDELEFERIKKEKEEQERIYSEDPDSQFSKKIIKQ